jgi:hypothetical protein
MKTISYLTYAVGIYPTFLFLILTMSNYAFGPLMTVPHFGQETFLYSLIQNSCLHFEHCTLMSAISVLNIFAINFICLSPNKD